MIAASVLALVCLKGWYLREFVVVFAAELGIYGVAAWRLSSGGLEAAAHGRNSLVVVLVVAVLLRCVALFAPQALSTDAYRYVWDGRVQAAGVNPYRYIPVDPALTALRDAAIYPHINRADYAHTIYPPTAQLVFLAVERLHDGIVAMKLAMFAWDGLSIACLIALLRSFGMPATRVIFYAWHPLPIWEFAGTGHVDALAIALLLLAVLCAVRRSPAWTGVALAAASLVKYYPVVISPALYRRWDWRMPAAFVATVSILYLPYLGVGRAVFGFLPGYVAEEGLGNGHGVFLWSLLQIKLDSATAASVYLPFAAAVLVGLTLWAQFGRPSSTMRSAAILRASVLLSALTLLVSPHDPWYFAVLIPFLCFRFSWAHFWLTGACMLMYIVPTPNGFAMQSLLYIPFLLLLLLQSYAHRHVDSPETFDANRSQPRTL